MIIIMHSMHERTAAQDKTGTRRLKLKAQLWGVYTIQQTSSISTRILNTFAGSLLDVCWIV